MISYSGYKYTGIKEIDIRSNIDSIINSANDFIIICGYNFTSDKTPGTTLNSLINSPVRIKHCILPIKLMIPNGPDVNRDKAIRLVNNGVSVSLEDLNHSKWIMTEKEIYYGSANFSVKSLKDRIEVVSFKDFYNNDPLKEDFLKFVYSSINKMFNHSDRRKLRGVITRNEQLIRAAKTMVKRFNPSIEKVEQTVNDYEEIKDSLIQILEGSYWFLTDKYYYDLVSICNHFIFRLNGIVSVGNEILKMKENDKLLKNKIELYNQRCEYFGDRVFKLFSTSEDYLISEHKLPSFSVLNRQIGKSNINTICKDYDWFIK